MKRFPPWLNLSLLSAGAFSVGTGADRPAREASMVLVAAYGTLCGFRIFWRLLMDKGSWVQRLAVLKGVGYEDFSLQLPGGASRGCDSRISRVRFAIKR